MTLTLPCKCGVVHSFDVPIVEPPKRMTRQQLARHFGKSVNTIDHWRKLGCPHTNIGGVEFDLSQVEKWREKFANMHKPRIWRSR